LKRIRWIFLVLVVIAIGCGEDVAKILTPTITSVSPASVNAGSENVAGTISGSNFNGVTAVSMGDGVTVHNFVGVNPSQITVTFSVNSSAAAGPRTVTITGSSGTGSSSNHFTVVRDNQPPIAKFSYSPKNVDTETEVDFDGSDSSDPDGSIVEYSWDFGDGKKATGKKVSHTFKDGKKFDVQLTVKDNGGLKTSNKKEIAVEKLTRIKCAGVHGRGLDYLFDVITSDKSKKTIIAKFHNEDAGCKAFYYCGDIRIGGWPPYSRGDEKWVGIMCQFYLLGDGVVEIHTKLGGVPASKQYWPKDGEKNFYTHAQTDCNPKDCTRDTVE
jgi:PKD repeat protein